MSSPQLYKIKCELEQTYSDSSSIKLVVENKKSINILNYAFMLPEIHNQLTEFMLRSTLQLSSQQQSKNGTKCVYTQAI